MTNAAKHAEAIYDGIRTTSGDRPFAFQSVEQMHRELAAWQANNPALRQIRQAAPEVLVSFAERSVDWVIAESRDHSNFRVTSTLVEVILYALKQAPKPLPSEVVLTLLNQLRETR